MPICEADPWRLQYFSQVETAANIPTEDSDAWQWYPAHRWVYDKLAVALSQKLAAGPHGTAPPRFPVFSKPIVNLRGMGVGSRMLSSPADYERHYAPGHFWMTLLAGRHVSSDVAVVGGEPRWWRHATGKPAGEGTFDYWTVHAAPDAEIEARCGAWVRAHLAGYTGMLNLETIDGTIIEAHLRFADQWPDLYGAGWVAALVRLYERGCGISPMRIGVTAIAWCCSGPRAAAIAIRRRRWSRRSGACAACRACRSPSARIGRRTATRCRRADFALPSSTASIFPARSPRASGSSEHFRV